MKASLGRESSVLKSAQPCRIVYGFGNMIGSDTSAVNRHLALWPQNETTTAL